MMELKKLTAIYQAANKQSIREIVVETKSAKIQMLLSPYKKKKPSKQATPQVAPPEELAGSSEAEQASKFDILSSQIGFFSRYNAKTKKHYVKLRDQVKKGEIVGAIRSMHLIYEVAADKPGKIVEFLVEEGQPVEYQQPLVRLVPTESS